MKFLIIGDLHGQIPNIYYKGFDAIIAPGDFCSDEAKKYMFMEVQKRIKDPTYKKWWYDMVGKTKAKRIVEKSLSNGRKVLEYLDSFGVPVYVIPGNWDWSEEEGKYDWKFVNRDYFKKIIAGLKNIRNIHNRIASFAGFQLIGYGLCHGPEYPQYEMDIRMYDAAGLRKKKRIYEKKYGKMMSLFRKARKPVIFLSHNVPYNTPLDEITNKKSPRYGYHYGSLVARKMIEKYQPLVCIGGHMHEHFGKCRIGRTVCINTGFGSNVNTWMELEHGKIKKLEFHKGG